MANNLIPEELNALIQEYLTDGVLTDKERQVILNKAEKMGLDRDEIDLYLDAQVQKIDQVTDAAVRRQKGKTCPYCGGSIPQLTDKCPHCGENITAQASEELQEIFDNLEDALVGLKSGKNVRENKAIVERFARKAKMYYGSNPKIQKLLEEVENESVKAEKVAKINARKNSVIKVLTYNWKISAGVALAIIIGVFMLFYKSPEAKIKEYVNNTETQVNKYIKDGNLEAAKELLTDLVVIDEYHDGRFGQFISDFDPIYIKVIDAYVKKGDLDSAESLFLAFKSKLGDYFRLSKCYQMLVDVFNKEGRDDSALKADY